MTTETEGIYMFCAIPDAEDQTFGKVKLAGEHRKVYTIPYEEMAMVVTRAPVQIYEPSRQNLKAHQDMVADIMKKHTVIPMSFGNVLQTEEDVSVLMGKLKPQFEEIFPRIKNKIEVGLKLVGKKEWIERTVKENPQLQSLKSGTAGKTKEAGYYDRIKLGEAARTFMTDLQIRFDEEIFQPLAKEADAAKNNDPVSERMVMNASFLVDRDKEQAFDELVNRIHDEWADKLDFKYTGPWPAYNFINIKLKAGDAS
ncbi:GvpL/GvpF family gas vesicle protein [Alteribacter natronophilus]|uniref:GvpL/GvpF family gas vesicle protein n=1 Tax=Alteribacter natronophilus TaxID=2583810 RepID=UPI00110EFA21|nr:GvpL/GvpF family gas vesicle protein [Alteribacter natronophilus]TMW72217.1 GvpL/GvpF family gas vesicle protein [Alteribacter natronophilus]